MLQSKGNKPVVSIALPVYNGAAHLREALQSFVNQEHRDFQLTICDNASTDATADIAQEFANADSRFIYSRQEEFVNARDNFTRAYRLTSAEHPYFMWACDDNLWHKSFLSRTIAYMEEHSDCSLCGYYLYEFDENLEKRERRVSIPNSYKRFRLLHTLFERTASVSIYGLIRRRALDLIKVDLTDIDDYPDRYILLQLRSHGHFHVVPEVLLGFRGGGISSTKDDPWVRTVVDLKFGERELTLLQSFRRYTALERTLVANKFAYQSLRHNIPNTASRWWLAPAQLTASLMNRIRPSAWRVGVTGLERHDES